MSTKKNLPSVFSYFSFFQYPPSFEQLYTFWPSKISKDSLLVLLDSQVKKGILVCKNNRYSLKNNMRYLAVFEARSLQSQRLLRSLRLRIFLSMLAWIPFIHFVGLSGSLATDNARRNDDIDLFVISSPCRMWSARAFCVLIAQLMGFRRRRNESHTGGKVCLNLFFDGADLALPKEKKGIFSAHEVLQVKPLINKNHMYERFLQANKWVRVLFPNAYIPPVPKQKKIKSNIAESQFERLARALQLYFINKHKTTEHITDTQLWFFPRDFEKKINKETSIYLQ